MSCKKDDFAAPEELLLHKIIYRGDSTAFITFEYDAQQRPISIIETFSDNSPKIITVIHYDSKGRMAGYTDGRSYAFDYNLQGQIIRKYTVRDDFTGDWTSNAYAYDAKGQLVADTSKRMYNNKPISVKTFQYDDSSNVIGQHSVDFYYNSSSFSSMEAQYDQMRSAYQNLGMHLYFIRGEVHFLCKNNPLMHIRPMLGKTAFQYEYNNAGLPKNITLKFDRYGSSQTHSIEFFYK